MEKETIFKKLSKLGVIDAQFRFVCYSDMLFTYMDEYDIEKQSKYEISFIADDTLLWHMTPKELLNLVRLEYFNLRIFDKTNKVIYDETFNLNDSNN